MNKDLAEEISSVCDILVKSAFFSEDEILEILEEQFIDEDIDLSEIDIVFNDCDNSNFSSLERAFEEITNENIVSIHNCGYDIEEGVGDAFELFIHLKNNDYHPIGFCFYTFEDVEESIFDSKLKITFGDFEKNENKALEIGKIIADVLKSFNFKVNWDETVDNQIEINPFKWDKSFNDNNEYEIEGAYTLFTSNH